MPLVATQVKRRRGTGVENDAFAGAEGEITVDLTNKELRVHDGSGKLGGFRIGRHTDRSNCITEIPQDIKLELNDGILTLKAGSKVYVPNSAGVFNIRNITADKTYTQTTNGQYLLLARQDTSIWGSLTSTTTSGTTPPTGTGTFYNTTTNSIDYYSSGTYNERHYSFPFALITVSNGAISSIDRVFNGFGYIGSTVFALPEVKGLIPNERNADGSLKSREFSVSRVLTVTSGNVTLRNYPLGITSSGIAISNYKYDEKTNTSGGVCIFGTIETVSGKITSFTPKTTFHALDYNDTEYIAHQSMPSDRYIDLTLPASGQSITAPADGYVLLAMRNTDVYCEMRLHAGTLRVGSNYRYDSPNYSFSLSIPVSKGDSVTTTYANMSPQLFRFIYAQGSK